MSQFASASAPAIDWDAIEGNLRGANAQENIMSNNQITHMIALLQMLNHANPGEWNGLRCEQFAAAIITLLTNSINHEDTAREIDNLLIGMAKIAEAPIISDTVLKVEFYRKLFLYLLGLGVSFATLQALAPGPLTLVLDYAFSLFQTLLTPQFGFNPNDIAAEAASSSPFSVGAFADSARNVASGAANLAATASSSLVTAAFSACAQVAATCLNAVNKAVCLGFNTDTLAFATQVAAATAATKVAEGLEQPVKGAYGAAMGEMDVIVARYLDSGGLSTDFNSVKNMAKTGYKQFKTKGIDAIETAFNDMNEITSAFTNASADWAQNRFIARSVNDIILEKLSEKVKGATLTYRTYLGNLITDLSEIDFSSSENEQSTTDTVIEKYSRIESRKINSLIILWKLAHKKNFVTRTQSLKKPEQVVKKTDPLWSSSLGDDPRNKDPIIYVKKPRTVSVFDPNINNIVSELHSISEKLNYALSYAGINPTTYVCELEQNFNGPAKSGLQQILRMFTDEQQNVLADRIITTKQSNYSSEYPTSTGNSKKDHINREKNKEPILNAIKNYYNTHSEQNKITKIYDDTEEQMDMSAGRRIKSTKAKKSRHNNKKRSTIKRKKARQMPRKTRKGKKKRYTQKRR